MEDRSSQDEGGQKAPELLVSQVFKKKRSQKTEKRKSKVAGWCTDKMEEKASKHEFKDTKRNGAMEEHQSGRNQYDLAKLTENLRNTCWSCAKWRKTREEHT